jgi:hypothetical protein
MSRQQMPQQQQQQMQHHHQHQDANDTFRHPLIGAVSMIHDINAQLSYFEREMAVKLDFLDARVEKLCFLVLPPRFEG